MPALSFTNLTKGYRFVNGPFHAQPLTVSLSNRERLVHSLLIL
jgi:hypothetical protein